MHLSTRLRDNLIPVLAGSYTPGQLDIVVKICLALASELLEWKSSSRRLMYAQGMNSDDLAYDCIADLFQRDDRGGLVQLKAYFASVDVETISESELLIYFRRLVYSRTNQAIFRIYQELDPTFSKILRNIKLAMQALRQFDEVELYGESYIAPILCEPLKHLPKVDPAQLQNQLGSVCSGMEHIPEMLGKLALYLRHQEEHSRLVPLMLVARTFQSLYASKNHPLVEASLIDDRTTAQDTIAIIKTACRTVWQGNRSRYVEKRKVTEEVFDTYLRVVEENLIARFVVQIGDEQSYFALLRMRIPELTEEDYRRHHRAKLEYLGSLARKRVVKQLKAGV